MPMTFLLMFADAKFPCCIARNIDENYYMTKSSYNAIGVLKFDKSEGH